MSFSRVYIDSSILPYVVVSKRKSVWKNPPLLLETHHILSDSYASGIIRLGREKVRLEIYNVFWFFGIIRFRFGNYGLSNVFLRILEQIHESIHIVAVS